MPNKDHEGQEAGPLAEKVKGAKQDGGASFKEFKGVEGSTEDVKADLNNTGVALPTDSEKHLPKAGKAV